MSAHEFSVRLGVLVHQRTDAWAAARGRNPLAVPEEKSRPDTAHFLFEHGSAPVIAKQILARLPDEANSVIASARRVQRLRFDLLGFSDLAFGNRNTPDWHLDPIHGVRAPSRPWFRVPYLDFHVVGDHKIIWELNRHQHFMLLARAWLFTNNTSFLETLKRLWHDWRKQNVYPFGINWASTLEVAFRSLSWIWVEHLLESAGLDDFRVDLRKGIAEHTAYVERYLSTYFAPNTHLLGEALAMFFAGVLYPQLRPAQRWKEAGWRIVLEQSQRQVRADGFHFEQSVYYHVYALDMFLWARILAAQNGISIPFEFDQVILRMADGLAALGAAGVPPRFGDNDGGRLFDGRRNETRHLLDPLATASIVYDRPDWKALAGEVREETFWLLSTAGIEAFDGLDPRPFQGHTRGFAESGYYIMHSGPGVLIMDAGPQGWGNGGHGHADALSVQLIANRHAWLTDPGTFSYPHETPERNRFRGTGAHNTLEVDGLSQSDPIHSFGWGSHPQTFVSLWHTFRGAALFRARHDGYHRLVQPVTHERSVIALPEGVWLIRDQATGPGSHDLRLHWHFSPGCRVKRSPGGFVISNGCGTLHFASAGTSAWRVNIETGGYSSAYGCAIPNPVLQCAFRGALPAGYAVVVTLSGPALTLDTVAAAGAEVYKWNCGAVMHVAAFSTGMGRWAVGPLKTDASVLLLQLAGDRLERAFGADASQIEIAGERLLVEPGSWYFDITEGKKGAVLTPTAIRALRTALERLAAPVLAEIPSIQPGT